MTKKKINILLFEDNPGDIRLFEELLRGEDSFDEVELNDVERLKTGLELLTRKKPDVILLDLGLPDSQGLQTFTSVYAQAPEIPIIVLTGFNDSDQVAEVVRSGAQDYLVKGEVSGELLMRAICHAVERKRAGDTLRNG